MPKIDVLSPAGKKTGTRDLPTELFEAKVSVPLMHQVVVAAMAGQRAGTHATKTRAQVRGGGKKPWRQKGTGRARQGSNRAPQWAGGGVVHGPQPKDHSMRVNKKMRKAALRSALTDALTSGKLVVVEAPTMDAPKTKQAVEALDGWKTTDGKVLVVLRQPTDNGAVEKSFRNLRGVRVAYAGGLGVYELIAADKVVLTTDALDALESKDAGSDGAAGGAPQRRSTSTDATGARDAQSEDAAAEAGNEAGDDE
jgi:large subunit ribosomal protein L4